MRKVLIGSLLLVVLVGIPACSPAQIEVLTGRVESRINGLLGELDVAKKNAELAIEDAENEVQRLQRVEAENRVEAEMLEEKLDSLRDTREDARQGLLRLADLLEKDEPYERSDGSIMSVEELKAYAERKKAEFETLEERIAVYEQALLRHKEAADEAHQRWTEGLNKIEVMRSKLELLDAQVGRLQALREDQTENVSLNTIDEAEQTVDETISDIEKDIRTIGIVEGFEAPEGITEDLIELDLKSATDLASELRELGGEGEGSEESP